VRNKSNKEANFKSNTTAEKLMLKAQKNDTAMPMKTSMLEEYKMMNQMTRKEIE
jgi:hypothetical protein